MKTQGIVKWFDNKKGFGFIVSEKYDEDIMLHFSAIIMSGFKTVNSGDKVLFNLDNKREEGLSAIDVEVKNF